MKPPILSLSQRALGIVLGCALAAGVLALCGREKGLAPGSQQPQQLMAECEGSLQRLVIHYTVDADETVLPVYRSFLSQLPGEVTVCAVCPDKASFRHLLVRLGRVPCRLVPLVVDHPITCWSRDRWLALVGDQSTTTLLCPRSEMGTEVWPARAGDQRVAEDLAGRLDAVAALRSGLYFDAGDFVTDSDTVLATPAVVDRNLHRTVDSESQLQQQLELQFGRPVVLLKDVPNHHGGMYMMPVGNRTMLVGDPLQGKRLWDEMDDAARRRIGLPGEPDFSQTTVCQFENVVQSCREAGYRVRRVPTVVSDDGRTYLTYVNAILDHREEGRIVYMPVYSGADLLNEEAARVWADLGYEVRPVDCTSCYRQFGTLHCLVNVLERGRYAPVHDRSRPNQVARGL